MEASELGVSKRSELQQSQDSTGLLSSKDGSQGLPYAKRGVRPLLVKWDLPI